VGPKDKLDRISAKASPIKTKNGMIELEKGRDAPASRLLSLDSVLNRDPGLYSSGNRH